MAEFEKITDQGIFELIEQLQKDRIIIKIHLLGKDYEHLTAVTGVRTKGRIPHFMIDYPRGFREAVTGVETWKIQFEFIGKDKVPYTFKTSGGQTSRGKILIRFPESIDRIQRREYFRLGAPVGTKIDSIINSTLHEIVVINISEGGALVSFGKGAKEKSFLKTGGLLRDLTLLFPSEEEELKVIIKKALVKTVEKDPLTNHYRYSLQFTDIEKDEKDALRGLIYKFQRGFLRRRQLTAN